jgi:hypothetical protein
MAGEQAFIPIQGYARIGQSGSKAAFQQKSTFMEWAGIEIWVH